MISSSRGMGPEAQKFKWHSQGHRGSQWEMRNSEFLTSLSCSLITKPHDSRIPQRFFHCCWGTDCSDVSLYFVLSAKKSSKYSKCSKYNLKIIPRWTMKGLKSNFCHFSLRKCNTYVPDGWVPEKHLSQHQISFLLATAQGMYLGEVKFC